MSALDEVARRELYVQVSPTFAAALGHCEPVSSWGNLEGGPLAHGALQACRLRQLDVFALEGPWTRHL